MRKIAFILCVVLAMMSICGCNSIESQTKDYYVKFDPKDIVLEFGPRTDDFNEVYYALLVTNNTDFTITKLSVKYTLPGAESLEANLRYNLPFSDDPIEPGETRPIELDYHYMLGQRSFSTYMRVDASMFTDEEDSSKRSYLRLDKMKSIVGSATLEYETIAFAVREFTDETNSTGAKYKLNDVEHSYSYFPSTNDLIENY